MIVLPFEWDDHPRPRFTDLFYRACPPSGPYGALILDSQGNLYGTTYRGGSEEGPCGGMAGCGVVFEITP